MEKNPILRIKDLKVSFQTGKKLVPAVDGISFELKDGEILGIVGESGSGKSVTSLATMGLIPSPPGKIENGEIIFEGKDLKNISEKEWRKIRGNQISMIFQEPMTSLNPLFTIGNQLMEAIRLTYRPFKARSNCTQYRIIKTGWYSKSRRNSERTSTPDYQAE